jgi:hypothetical protein
MATIDLRPGDVIQLDKPYFKSSLSSIATNDLVFMTGTVLFVIVVFNDESRDAIDRIVLMPAGCP